MEALDFGRVRFTNQRNIVWKPYQAIQDFVELNRRIKNRDISYFDLPSNLKPIVDKTPHPYDLITDKIENIKKIIEKEEER